MLKSLVVFLEWLISIHLIVFECYENEGYLLEGFDQVDEISYFMFLVVMYIQEDMDNLEEVDSFERKIQEEHYKFNFGNGQLEGYFGWAHISYEKDVDFEIF